MRGDAIPRLVRRPFDPFGRVGYDQQLTANALALGV
jgi:hypothetical protein